jgi:formate hydrogenlyase transcriptional activator
MSPNGQNRPEASSADLREDDPVWLAALDSLPTGVLVAGSDDVIVFANRRAAEMLGSPPAELAGRSVDAVVAGALAHQVTSQEPDGPRPGPEARRTAGSRSTVERRSCSVETRHGHLRVVTLDNASDAAASHDEQVKFERLVSELSVRFINLPVEHVDGAIREALGQIGERLDLDRCSFYRIEPDGILTDAIWWARPDAGPPPAPVRAQDDFPWALEQLRAGQMLSFTSVDEIPSAVDREGYRSLGIRSAVTLPLLVDGEVVGAVGFNSVRRERRWDAEALHRLTVLSSAFNGVLARRKHEEALRQAFAEVARLRDQLAAENVQLRHEVKEQFGRGQIIGQSEALRRVMTQVRQVALTDATVLLLGETGTGKELIASQIHELSARRKRSMVRVSCAAIPAALIESELFGRERGAFTGALSRQIGRFELADQSTIFLDEIGDLPPEVQVKLLRVLEERQIERLGSPRAIPVDTRIIAATHRDLERRMVEGEFREDLFYRLNVFPILIPPLRERAEDIPLLVWRFVEEFSRSFGKRVESIPPANMAQLQQYSWPGNIRELRNLVERAVIVASGPVLTISPPETHAIPAAAARSSKLVDLEREHIRATLESTGWRIRGADGAAERLGLRPTTLETRIAKLGLVRPRPTGSGD